MKKCGSGFLFSRRANYSIIFFMAIFTSDKKFSFKTWNKTNSNLLIEEK